MQRHHHVPLCFPYLSKVLAQGWTAAIVECWRKWRPYCSSCSWQKTWQLVIIDYRAWKLVIEKLLESWTWINLLGSTFSAANLFHTLRCAVSFPSSFETGRGQHANAASPGRAQGGRSTVIHEVFKYLQIVTLPWTVWTLKLICKAFHIWVSGIIRIQLETSQSPKLPPGSMKSAWICRFAAARRQSSCWMVLPVSIEKLDCRACRVQFACYQWGPRRPTA